MAGKFVLKKSGKGKFSFTLSANNGLVILTSQAYADRSGALNGIESVRKNAGKAASFEQRTAKNGQPYFVLKASNQEIIGQSQMYKSASSVKKGMASVKANARSAELDDQTAKK